MGGGFSSGIFLAFSTDIMHCLSAQHVLAVGLLCSYLLFFPIPLLSLSILSDCLKLGFRKISLIPCSPACFRRSIMMGLTSSRDDLDL